MLDGVILLWFLLTAVALIFVAVDIRATPESPVLKWGFVLVTAYTRRGPRFSLRAWLPRALARAARTLYCRALAANAGVDDALRGRRWQWESSRVLCWRASSASPRRLK